MRADVARDLSESASAFLDIVWPKVLNIFGGGDLIPVEGVTTDDMSKRLDMLAGIDGWHVVNNVGMRGIASRVQWETPYASFTVRKRRTSGAETEWAKRRLALLEPERGWLAPHLIIQAYVSKRERKLLYAAVVRACDLYRFATDVYKNVVWQSRSNGDDGNEFAVFWVPWLERQGVTVKTYIDFDVKQRGLLIQPRTQPRDVWDHLDSSESGGFSASR